jgi:exopolysaccharide biosynthesis polyprenyl glycosylphosphotransferase
MTDINFVSRQADWAPSRSLADRLARRYAGRRFWRDALKRRMLAAGDTLAVAVASALLLAWGATPQAVLEVLAFLPGWLLLAKLCGLYDQDHRSLFHLTVDEFPRLISWIFIGTACLTLVALMSGVHGLRAAERIELWVILLPLVPLTRVLVRGLWRRITPPERAMIVGAGAGAESIERKAGLLPDLHMKVVSRYEERELDLDQVPGLLVGIDRVVVAAPNVSDEMVTGLLSIARSAQVKLSVLPPIPVALGTAVHVSRVADLPLLEYHTWDNSRSTLLGKRVLDLIVGSVALVVTAPLMAIAAIAILVSSGRPVLFVQRRAGLNGRPFSMLKFRTMDKSAGLDEKSNGHVPKRRDDPRVTRVGYLLRRWSIDELPQLVNVLRGEMSLVGPRPEECGIVEKYAPEHRFRLFVKPGLTGPMQIHGRGALTLTERLAAERAYVDDLSVIRDLRILASTIAPVLRRTGAF